MKFSVAYYFVGNEEESVQLDIVDAKDAKSCLELYDPKEYDVLEIEEYDEDKIMEEMYEDSLIDDDDEFEEDYI